MLVLLTYGSDKHGGLRNVRMCFFLGVYSPPAATEQAVEVLLPPSSSALFLLHGAFGLLMRNLFINATVVPATRLAVRLSSSGILSKLFVFAYVHRVIHGGWPANWKLKSNFNFWNFNFPVIPRTDPCDPKDGHYPPICAWRSTIMASSAAMRSSTYARDTPRNERLLPS